MNFALFLPLFVLLAAANAQVALKTDEDEAASYLVEYDTKTTELYKEYSIVSWGYNTNLTEYNQQKLLEQTRIIGEWDNKVQQVVRSYDYKNFKNATLKRVFGWLDDAGMGILSTDEQTEFSTLENTMTSFYSNASVCRQKNDVVEECLSLGDLTKIFEVSRDQSELEWAWTGFRNQTGRRIRKYYPRYAELMNKAARANGFDDAAEWRLSEYEWPDIEKDAEAYYQQLKPFYEHLHAYVRRKLEKHYRLHEGGHIDAQLLGGMWAQGWASIYDMVKPYDTNSVPNLDKKLAEKNYTRIRMVKEAEKYFVSLGFNELPESFWTLSQFEKPKDRQVVCHASAWDMSNGDDVRLKMCIRIAGVDFFTIHHELGHNYYQLAYAPQPYYFRESATPAFHEAIGDAITLAVSTPGHLVKIGLLDNYDPTDQHGSINYLLSSALSQVTFLPFGYLVDKWRFGVLRGETSSSHYNRDWWKLRCDYQGIQPPNERTEVDFDPGAKYHIASGSGYLRYFLSHLLQFELYKAMCEKAEHTGPLHTCDFYESKPAGTLLNDVLKLGSSKPWREVMSMINGRDTQTADAILEYYQPLIDWLKKENEGHNVGWSAGCPVGSVSKSSKNQGNILYLCLTTIVALTLRYVR